MFVSRCIEAPLLPFCLVGGNFEPPPRLIVMTDLKILWQSDLRSICCRFSCYTYNELGLLHKCAISGFLNRGRDNFGYRLCHTTGT